MLVAMMDKAETHAANTEVNPVVGHMCARLIASGESYVSPAHHEAEAHAGYVGNHVQSVERACNQ